MNTKLTYPLDEVDDEILRQRYGWGGDDADSSNAGTTGGENSRSNGNDDIKLDAFGNNSDSAGHSCDG